MKKDVRGFTIIELLLALVMALVVVIASGAFLVTTQETWKQGQTKVALQQDASRCLETMARDIRRARSVNHASGILTLYDAEGAVLRSYSRNAGTEQLLMDATTSMSEFKCTQLAIAMNTDKTRVDVTLELKDKNDNKVKVSGKTALRNLNHLEP